MTEILGSHHVTAIAGKHHIRWSIRDRLPTRAFSLVAVRLLFFAFIGSPIVASGQVQGKVVDTFTQPLSEVHVELWGAIGRIAFTRTDGSGNFYFLHDATVSPVGIVARRVGYRPLTASFANSAANRTYVMERVTTSLPTAVSNATRRACPNVESPDAREAWTAIRRSYGQPPYGSSWSISAVADSGFVEAERVGQVNEERLRGTGRGIGGAQRLADSGRIADSGYAYRWYRAVSGRSQPRWSYAMLHSYMVQHFLDPLFAVRHTLSWLARPEPARWR